MKKKSFLIFDNIQKYRLCPALVEREKSATIPDLDSANIS